MAADLSLAGFQVRLFDLPQSRHNLDAAIERGGIEISGEARCGFAKIDEITTDIHDAVEDTDVVMVVTPAHARLVLYETLAPCLQEGQIVVTHTGNHGSLQLSRILSEKHVENVIISECSILIYACKIVGPAKVKVSGVKRTVTFSALPARNTSKALTVVREIFPQFTPAKNVLETSLSSLNLVFHPTIMLLNAGRVEDTKGDFMFYVDGLTPSVARIMDSLDAERLDLGKALGLNLVSARDWLREMYGSIGNTTLEAVQNTKAYKDRESGSAPSTLMHRYLTEDTPYGLVPMASIGESFGLTMPMTRALITLISVLNGTDYWAHGLTVEKLGISHLSLSDLDTLLHFTGSRK